MEPEENNVGRFGVFSQQEARDEDSTEGVLGGWGILLQVGFFLAIFIAFTGASVWISFASVKNAGVVMPQQDNVQPVAVPQVTPVACEPPRVVTAAGG